MKDKNEERKQFIQILNEAGLNSDFFNKFEKDEIDFYLGWLYDSLCGEKVLSATQAIIKANLNYLNLLQDFLSENDEKENDETFLEWMKKRCVK